MSLKSLCFIVITYLVQAGCFATYCVDDLSLEEKVGQLLLVHFNGKEVNDDAKTLIQSNYVGGFIYYNWANGLSSPKQVYTLSLNLQQLTQENRRSIPLFIALDQEGGAVNRLSKGFTIFPGNRALSMASDPKLATLNAFASGKELLAVGVNMNLAPVVDINSNPKNPVIGIRSFGNLTEDFLLFANNMIDGYHQAGIITSLKHFPGHGDVGVDPHECLPVVNKSKEDLSQVELVPFAALAYKADTIMTAHIIIPALDTHYCATLSEKILGLLRNEMGFKGVIISDSLAMEGVLKNGGSIDEIAVLAFNAGCDILMLGGKQLIGANKGFELTISDVQRVHQHLVNAVKTGSIKEDRLNESVKRILDLKNQYHLFNRESPAFHEEVIRSPDHLNLAQKIATKALRTSKHCSISAGAMTIVAPQMLKEAIDQISLQGPVLFFNEPNPTKEEVDFILASVKDHDSAVFFSYNAWKFPYQSLLLQSLLEAKKQVILVVTGDPLDSSLFSKANMVITTFSPSVASIRAASTVIIEAITSEDKE